MNYGSKLIMLLWCLSTMDASHGIVVDVKRSPVFETVYLKEIILLQDGGLSGSCVEVASRFISHGDYYWGGGDYDGIEYRLKMRYMGSLCLDPDQDAPADADVYALTIVEQQPSIRLTNHVAIIYQGQQKAVFTSKMLHVLIGPAKIRSLNLYKSAFDISEEEMQSMTAEYQDKCDRDTLGGVKKNQARVDGDRLTIYMPEIPLALFITSVRFKTPENKADYQYWSRCFLGRIAREPVKAGFSEKE